MKKFFLPLALLTAICLPATVMAGSPAPESAAGTPGQAGHNMSMSGHELVGQSKMIMLGDTVVDGVKAGAHLYDIREAMAKMGMQHTHHFMVNFLEAETGKPITTGTVALKIKGPDQVESAPIPLTSMQGEFGADIVLAAPGHYEFTVGTRLADGKTRQFHFSYQPAK